MDNNSVASRANKNFFSRTATEISEFYEEYKAQRPVASKIVMLTIASVMLAIILLLVHNQTIQSKADSFDDYQYVFQNNLVQNPSFISVKRFFTEVLYPTTVQGYYQPLAMVSLMIDCALGGSKDNIAVFHITSLLIHILNSVLVLVLFYLLFKKIWLSFIGGLLFGIHPIAIEEIAWLSERKSILATLFLLLSLILYIIYVKSSKKRYLWISLAVFIPALLSKPIAVSLPCILLLLDYLWYKKLTFLKLLEKVPYFIIALVFAIIAYISQNNTAIITNTTQTSSILQIFLLISYNNIFYLWKIIFPTQLSPFYSSIEPISLTNSAYLIPAILTISIIVFFIITWRWSKPLLLGYLFYLVSILPTSGIIKVTSAITCIKYAYFPSIGIFICLIILLNNFTKLKINRPAKYIITLILIFSISIGEVSASTAYSSKWKDSETLNIHILNINPNSAMIINSLAGVYIKQLEFDKSIEYLNEALKLNPNYYLTYVNLATALSFKEQDSEAISMYNKAIELGIDNKNHLSIVLFNMGKIYKANSYLEDAKKYFEESIRLNPENINAKMQLALVINQLGDFNEAVSICKSIIKDYPSLASTYNYLGIIYAENEDYNQAITQFSISMRLNPYESFTYYTLGNTLVNYGKFSEASMCYDEALKLDPTNTNIYNQYAKLYAQQGKFNEAIDLLEKSVALLENSEAYLVLGKIYEDTGKYKEAINSYQKALDINPNIQDIQENINSLKEKIK